VGPDGAIYVIDYYRHIIEHPQWMDDEAVRTMDLYAGTDLGRIYRITRTGAAGPDWLENLDLGNAGNEDLAASLESPNMWWRRNAQRLLVAITSRAMHIAPTRVDRGSDTLSHRALQIGRNVALTPGRDLTHDTAGKLYSKEYNSKPRRQTEGITVCV
jgi:hypothetical protein